MVLDLLNHTEVLIPTVFLERLTSIVPNVSPVAIVRNQTLTATIPINTQNLTICRALMMSSSWIFVGRVSLSGLQCFTCACGE